VAKVTKSGDSPFDATVAVCAGINIQTSEKTGLIPKSYLTKNDK